MNELKRSLFCCYKSELAQKISQQKSASIYLEGKFMLQTIRGIYKNGKIELAETPKGITESLVFVTFLEIKPTTCPEIIIEYQGVAESINFESYRNELLPPNEVDF
jgi:hypothetical protein